MTKILIVEDDEEMCGELREILMASKYSVTCVHDGAQGASVDKEK